MARARTHAKMSTKKKVSAMTAMVLIVALLLGGAYAWRDFTQSYRNVFHGAPDADVLLHDDFTPGENKDVYVENTGRAPLLVRVQFAEYFQIGNDIYAGQDIDNKKTYDLHLFENQPDPGDGLVNWWELKDNGFKTSDYYDWFMTGHQKIYLPGVSEWDDIEYTAENITGGNGNKTKNTLGNSEIILISEYTALSSGEKATLKPCWILDDSADGEGWAYWSQLLLPGNATNLLLDNVLLKDGIQPDDNFVYAIDVRLNSASATEWKKLLPASANAEKLIGNIIDAYKPTKVIGVQAFDGTTRIPNNGTVRKPVSINAQNITFTANVLGNNLKLNTVTWSIVSQTGAGATIDPVTGKVILPNNYTGSVVIKATANDDNTKSTQFTMIVAPEVTGFKIEYPTHYCETPDTLQAWLPVADNAAFDQEDLTKGRVFQATISGTGTSDLAVWTFNANGTGATLTANDGSIAVGAKAVTLKTATATAGTVTITAAAKDDPGKSKTFTVQIDGLGMPNIVDAAVKGGVTVVGDKTAGTDTKWWPIAQYTTGGKTYYLIVRDKVIENSATVYGTTSDYLTSNVKSKIDSWYNNLSGTSKIKQYAVESNALARLGSNSSGYVGDGFSKPTPGVGTKAAFSLSQSEGVKFCGRYYYTAFPPLPAGATGTSSPFDQGIANGPGKNWTQLSDRTSVHSWLRSPGYYPASAGAMHSIGNVGGYTLSDTASGRPALWVTSDFFTP